MKAAKKGIALEAEYAAGIVLVIAAIVILLLIWASVSAEAGGPVSEIFYKIFDWLASILA